jgi:hypothetical protein
MGGNAPLKEEVEKAAGIEFGNEAAQLDDVEIVELTGFSELLGADEEGIDVHIARRIGDKPVDPFDDEEIAEEIAVKGVKEEEAAGLEDAARFGDEKGGLFDVLEDIHGRDDVEGVAGKGE